MRKGKDWMTRNHVDVTEWSDMSTHILLFQWSSTIQIKFTLLLKIPLVSSNSSCCQLWLIQCRSTLCCFTHGVLSASVAQALMFCVVLGRPLFIFCPLSCHCIVVVGIVVVMILRQLDIQLHMQSVPITTDVCEFVRISTRVMCTTLCDNVCQWLPTDQWFSPGIQ